MGERQYFSVIFCTCRDSLCNLIQSLQMFPEGRDFSDSQARALFYKINQKKKRKSDAAHYSVV